MVFEKFNEFIEKVETLIFNFDDDKINEELTTISIDSKSLDVPIAVCIATYNIEDNNRGRGNYISAKKMLTANLQSIKNQTYKNWKIFIVGDCFQPEEEIINILKANLKDEEYVFFNLKEPGERGKIEPKYLRNSAGVKARNTCIKLAKKEGFEYFASIDHDDVWKPTHLESMMKAFQQDSDIAFRYHRASKARSKGDGKGVYYWGSEENSPTLYYGDLPYKIVEAPHSGIVWHGPSCGWPKYRTVPQMQSQAPKREKIMGGDGDFFYNASII